METMGPRIAREVRKEMGREGITGTKEELNAIYSKRFNKAVSVSALETGSHVADATSGSSGTQ